MVPKIMWIQPQMHKCILWHPSEMCLIQITCTFLYFCLLREANKQMD